MPEILRPVQNCAPGAASNPYMESEALLATFPHPKGRKAATGLRARLGGHPPTRLRQRKDAAPSLNRGRGRLHPDSLPAGERKDILPQGGPQQFHPRTSRQRSAPRRHLRGAARSGGAGRRRPPRQTRPPRGTPGQPRLRATPAEPPAWRRGDHGRRTERGRSRGAQAATGSPTFLTLRAV